MQKNIHNWSEILRLEVTQAPNLPAADRQQGLWNDFAGQLVKKIKNLISNNKMLQTVSYSFTFDSGKIKRKSLWQNEFDLLEKYLEMAVRNAPFGKNYNDLQTNGFNILQSLDVQPGPPVVFHSMSDDVGQLDSVERVRQAYEKKSKHYSDSDDLILIIHTDNGIPTYYRDEIGKYFAPLKIPFKEIWIIETILGGGSILIKND